jgi:Leucine-rich repeat (LRR) protein
MPFADANINLDGQNLTTLPETLRGRINTMHLSAYNNQLTSVPEWIWDLTQLRTLNLATNQLTTLSETIHQLEHLRMLDVGHNRITQLPDALGELPSLTDFLYLSDNGFTQLWQYPSLIECNFVSKTALRRLVG